MFPTINYRHSQLGERLFALFLAVTLPLILVQPASAVILLSDDFSTVNSNTWTRANTGSASSLANGTLSLNSGANTASQRATLISKSNVFNPFLPSTENITAIFTGLNISGTPSMGANNTSGGANAFYAYIGNTTGGNGTGNGYAYGEAGNYLSVSIQNRVDTNNARFTQLGLFSRGSGATSQTVNLSSTPTAFSWTVDGKSSRTSFTLTGATFTSQLPGFVLSAEGTTMTGVFSNFTAASLGGDSSYLAIGGMNIGAVTGATLAELDSISVSAVPEPSTLALLTIAGAVGFVLFKRRRSGLK